MINRNCSYCFEKLKTKKQVKFCSIICKSGYYNAIKATFYKKTIGAAEEMAECLNWYLANCEGCSSEYAQRVLTSYYKLSNNFKTKNINYGDMRTIKNEVE